MVSSRTSLLGSRREWTVSSLVRLSLSSSSIRYLLDPFTKSSTNPSDPRKMSVDPRNFRGKKAKQRRHPNERVHLERTAFFLFSPLGQKGLEQLSFATKHGICIAPKLMTAGEKKEEGDGVVGERVGRSSQILSPSQSDRSREASGNLPKRTTLLQRK